MLRFRQKRFAVGAVVAAVVVASASVFAHVSFRPKDVNPLYDGRQYKEGISTRVSLVIPHGCTDADGNKFATRDVFALLPSTVDLSDSTYTVDENGNEFAGNAVMSVRPRVDNNWKKIQRKKAAVPTYFNHGPNDKDTVAVRWLKGNVPDDMSQDLELDVSLPRLKGCVERLRVYVTAVQYCGQGLRSAWIREPTAEFCEEEISPGYAPFFDVVRDRTANPLPPECGDVGTTVEAYPTAEEIDQYLTK